MTVNPLGAQYGTLIMSGWIGTDPRDGTDIVFLYLATPGDGTLGLDAAESMALLAEAAGFDPLPGSMTPRGHDELQVMFPEHGGVRVVFPAGEYVEHPGSPELRQLAQRKGELVLLLSYLTLPAGVDTLAHADRTTDALACSFGLVPVR